MSWSESITPMTRDELAAREPASDPAKHSLGQYEAVRDAAVAVIDAGTLGDPALHRFSGNFAGHANPGHLPTPPMANDQVYFSLSQAPKEAS